MGKFSYSASDIYCSTSKLVFLLFIALQPSALFSQSEFVVGYEAGYRETACYYYDAIRCGNLKIPLAPVPTDKEEITFRDGYNRGIQEALHFFYEEQNKQKIKKFIPVKWKYIPDYNAILAPKKSNAYSTMGYAYNSNIKGAYYATFKTLHADASSKIVSALSGHDYTSEAYALLGFNYYKIGHYDLAIPYLKDALKEDVDKKEDVKQLLKRSKRLNASMKKYYKKKQESYSSSKSREKRQKSYSISKSGGDLYRNQIYPDAYSGIEFRGGLYRDGDYNTVFGGLNLTISLSRQSSIIFDFESYTPIMTYENEYLYGESQDIHFIQGNLLFRHRLTNHLEFLYGPGVATAAKDSDMLIYYAVGGFQIFMSNRIFIDMRINYDLGIDKLLIKPGEMNVKLGLGLRL